MAYTKHMQRAAMHRDTHAKYLLTIALLFFLAGLPVGLASEELVHHRFVTAKQDTALEDILYLTIGVELAKEGFSSSKDPEAARYFLIISYDSRETEADITLSLFESGNATSPVGETSTTYRIDYTLDSEIAKAIRGLLETAGLLRSARAASTHESVIEGVFSTPLGNEMSPGELRAATALRIGVSAAPGGMVFLGAMTDYFHYGATGAIMVTARKPWKDISVMAGVRLTGTRVFNDAGIIGGPLILSTVGVNAEIGTGYSKAFRLSAAVSGGAAILSVASEPMLNKTVPYADIGATVRLPVGKVFFAGIDVRYMLIFDNDLLIMGLVPLFSLYKEF